MLIPQELQLSPHTCKNIAVSHYFFWLNVVNKLPLKRNKAY